MRLLVVNPNTTASMTRKIGAAAMRAASPGTEVVAVNPQTGPVSIEGYYDEAISVPLFYMVTLSRVAPRLDWKPSISTNTHIDVQDIKFKK